MTFFTNYLKLFKKKENYTNLLILEAYAKREAKHKWIKKKLDFKLNTTYKTFILKIYRHKFISVINNLKHHIKFIKVSLV